MEKSFLYGKHIIIDEKTVLNDAALVYQDGIIIDIGPYQQLMEKHRPKTISGSSDSIIMPGLVNAHGHGRGLTDFQLGTLDDIIERWKFRSYPGLNLSLDTIWRSLLLIETGITSTMHNHNLSDPNNHLAEFNEVIDSYQKTGLKVAFAPTFHNQNLFVYEKGDDFKKTASAHVRSLVQNHEHKVSLFNLKSYLSAVDWLRKERSNEYTTILHGPLAPQWCTKESLMEINRHAKANSMRVHIHVLQTALQKEYGIRHLKKSLIEYLYSIDFLDERTTCGHSIWLNENDLNILASTKSSVTNHPSCNLRIQSGISPVKKMLDKEITVGIGMDDKTFDDRKDFFTEMRLAAKLHRLGSLHFLEGEITSKDVFKMGTHWGGKIIGFPDIGKLHKGCSADILEISYNQIAYPYQNPDTDPIDLLLYRGQSCIVQTVIIAGETILQNREFTKIDKNEIASKLVESLPNNYAELYRKEKEKWHALQQHISQHYKKHGWLTDNNVKQNPFYEVNSRR